MHFIATFCFVVFSSFASATTFITVCYEDKNAPPFFLGSGFDVPQERPGATIDILKSLEKQVSTVRFVFVRKPWQRCLKNIKENKVDAVVASYRSERSEFLRFPKNLDGSINLSLAISMLGTCLVGQQGLAIDVANKNFPLSLAVPRGYAVLKTLQEDLYRVILTDSQEDAYQLVLKSLVDSSLGLCKVYDEQVAGFPHSDKLQAIFPPIDISYGYLALSKGFMAQNPLVAQTLWDKLGSMQLHQFYLDYVTNPTNHKQPRY
ncbi:transporter substrate-binding domain-containing protein [Pseudoalteromonas luteoviolacea]|uniref:Solute-binding protein family 3/N-terminal domain-containing protein n=1 Tax=Pseudoalteromonas luteoviolacea NCIMB 1942 TaxID=1365253 RepID=A0A167GWE5_9GAMM|nr:transporter substrate-binding domain-containing protein [Pseudoalteromonas luteoviolacea]KZN57107.1 hypothetical protein N482_04650 [Pseudoalteromonas luteoviolacea NCIMB 1942]